MASAVCSASCHDRAMPAKVGHPGADGDDGLRSELLAGQTADPLGDRLPGARLCQCQKYADPARGRLADQGADAGLRQRLRDPFVDVLTLGAGTGVADDQGEEPVPQGREPQCLGAGARVRGGTETPFVQVPQYGAVGPAFPPGRPGQARHGQRDRRTLQHQDVLRVGLGVQPALQQDQPPPQPVVVLHRRDQPPLRAAGRDPLRCGDGP